MDVDPVASLRQWAIEIPVGSTVLRVPPLPAADWIAALIGLDLWAVLDLAEGFDVEELLMEGGTTVAEVQDALLKVVASAAGRTPWAAMTLVHTATTHWQVVGAEMMRFAPRLDEMPFGAALDMIYATLGRCMDDKGMRSFNVALNNAPPELGGAPTRVRAERRIERPLPASAEPFVRERAKTRLRTPPLRPGVPTSEPTPPPPPPSDSDPASSLDALPAAPDGHPAV